MASVRSDDEGEERSHPLAQERPGVYVQVVSPRRRKARPSAAEPAASSEEKSQPGARMTHVAEVVPAHEPALDAILDSALDALPKPGAAPAPDSERPSGEREIIAVGPSGYQRGQSENSNGRDDNVVVTLPPPPRLPSFLPPGLSRTELEFSRSAAEVGPSVLDAPVGLEEPAPRRARAPWGILLFVIAASAIIASAAVVALRGSSSSAESEAEPALESSPAPPDLSPRAAEIGSPPGSATAPAAAGNAPSADGQPAPAFSRQLPAMGPDGVLPAPAAPGGAGAKAATPATAAAVKPAAPGVAASAAPTSAAPAAPNRAGITAPVATGARAPQAPRAVAPEVAPAEAPSELPDNPYAD